MNLFRTAAAVAIVVGSFAIVVGSRSPAWAAIEAADQDALTRAKALYTSAAYDEALALLNQFQNGSLGDALEVNQYRAFCLLALGRDDDARKVIQEIVEAHPTFRPSQTQISPRLLDAFRDVRRRVLPSVVRRSYEEAKAAFDRKEFEVAGKGFNTVLGLLEDDDARASGELSDLKMLSNGFLDLIKTTPPPTPAQPVQVAAPPAPPPAAPPAPAVFEAGAPDVTPPAVVSQAAPPWHPARQQLQTYDATLSVVIDERGDVTSVDLDGNLDPDYAAALKRAASRWKYRPATRRGLPVKYRKVIGIHLSPVDDRPTRQER